MAATALNRGDERTKALRETISELFSMDEPRKRYAARMSGLDVRYDLGHGHRTPEECGLDHAAGSARMPATIIHTPIVRHLHV